MIELLAPAGSMESITAAVQNGADAVYFGYGNYNARRNAKNFSEEEAAAAVSYCHLRGCKVNLTMNSLMTVNEYNNGVGPFKAYVDDDGRLILSRPCLSIEDEDAFGPQIEDLLIEMVSDSNKEALAPLLALLA